MSHYYCSEHTDNADSRCITCEAAREWVEKDSTISTLQARINALTAEVEEQARLLGASGSREAELLARIEALEAQQRWVPVEERLPGRNEIVIVEMLMRNGERRYDQMIGELIQYNAHVIRWMYAPQEPSK